MINIGESFIRFVYSGRSQMTAMNGKRPSSIPSRHQPETLAQHFDLIKYIYDCEYRLLICIRYKLNFF